MACGAARRLSLVSFQCGIRCVVLGMRARACVLVLLVSTVGARLQSAPRMYLLVTDILLLCPARHHGCHPHTMLPLRLPRHEGIQG